jgi:hypothetical protein
MAASSIGLFRLHYKWYQDIERENKHLEIITLIFPEINDGARRSLFSGTIDVVGTDLRRLKEMGVNQVIFGPMDPDLDRVIDTAKQLTKYSK